MSTIGANIIALVALVLVAFLLKNSLIGFFKSTVDIWTKYVNYFVSGIFITIGLSLVSVLIGTLIGFLVYTMRNSKAKVLSTIAKAFVEIIRGTPLLVQLFIVFFGTTSLIDIRQAGIPTALFAFISGVIAVSINSGAYVSEIIRSGIQSVPKG